MDSNVTSGNFLVVRILFGTGANRTFTASGNGYTYTDQVVTTNGATAPLGKVQITTAPITSSAALTVTVSASSSATWHIYVDEVTGQDTTTPVSATGTEENGTNVTSHNFTSSGLTIASGDLWFGAMAFSANPSTVTDASGFTRDVLNTSGSQTVYSGRSSTAGTSQFTATSATARGHKGVAIVVAQAAAAGGQPTRKRWGGVVHNGYTRGGVW